jgi:hypothetical protein
MSQLKAGDVVRLKRNAGMSPNLANDAALDDGNILDLPSIAEGHCDDLITHACLWLLGQKLTPRLGKCLHGVEFNAQHQRREPAAPGVEFETERDGWLPSAACWGSAFPS